MKGEITFAVAAKADYQAKMNDWAFNVDDESVHAIGFKNSQIFKMTDDFSVDNLEKFANDFKDGKLKPFIKSEPVPENNDGPVKVSSNLLISLLFLIFEYLPFFIFINRKHRFK